MSRGLIIVATILLFSLAGASAGKTDEKNKNPEVRPGPPIPIKGQPGPPIVNKGPGLACIERCQSDQSCPPNQKCCHYKCGSSCVSKVMPCTPGTAPFLGSRGCPNNRCPIDCLLKKLPNATCPSCFCGAPKGKR